MYIRAQCLTQVVFNLNKICFTLQSKIPFTEVLCKNRYVGRTFIQPSTRLRQLGVAKKFGALSENVKGRKIILIDDSIVRGNTIGPIIKLLRDAGAKEVRNFLYSSSSHCRVFFILINLHLLYLFVIYMITYRFILE